jgi:signal transduction histidine kinase
VVSRGQGGNQQKIRPRPRSQPRTDYTGRTIGQRVARILALPTVVVLLLLGVVASNEIQQYRTSRSTSHSVELALAVQNLVHTLQTERGVTAAVLGGNASFKDELGPARGLVDEQRAALATLIDQGVDSGQQSGAEQQIKQSLTGLDDLKSIRTATDTASATRALTFAYFTERISALSTVDLGLDRSTDTELRKNIQTLQALQDATEATAQERAFMNGVFSAGGFGDGEFVQFAAMRAARQDAWKRFDRFATEAQKKSATFVLGTGAAQETDYFEQIAVDSADGRHIVVNPQSWWSGLTTVLDDMNQLQEHVGSQIQQRAAVLQRTAAVRLGTLLAVVILFLAGSIYLAILASKAITQPLAALASEADNVASNRLPNAVHEVQSRDLEAGPPAPPDPVRIPVRATTEIRSVAHALDRLQSVAFGLATDQAVQRRHTIESLANLGRRNQNLIRRQLGFITSLEREEIDPNSLANLFELDHLATRMRRNASSLLVLVGASSPRQWNAPVPVADVIRAAVSEVEEYRRVVLRRMDDVAIIGPAVGSLAHLLSELIENGLTFSPPDSEVEVQGRLTVDGYLIAITDQGVGMTAQELDLANSRLRGEGDFIAAPTRFLGHFVVGQLAQQLAISVQLIPSPMTGVTARALLPKSLLNVMVSSPTGQHSGALPPGSAEISPPGPEEPATVTQIRAPAADGGRTTIVGGSEAQTDPGVPTPAAGIPATIGPPEGRAPTPTAPGTAPGVPVWEPPAATSAPDEIQLPDSPVLPAAPWSSPSADRTPPPAYGSTGPDPRLAPPRPMFADEMAAAPPSVQEPQRGPRDQVPPAATILLRPDALMGSGTPSDTDDGDQDLERTRNGLVKRRPKQERESDTRAAAAPRQPMPSARPTPMDSAPDQISARLTALRNGMRRGQGTPSGPPTTTDRPNPLDQPQEQR